MNTKTHWENVFASKSDAQKSWYEEFPYSSMNLITELGVKKDASIIDIGGGDSHLVDALLENGYTNISVLDISENALQNAKRRLGSDANRVKWIVSDVLKLKPIEQYDCWHDRAVFHFITDEKQIANYLSQMVATIKEGGNLILATFSEEGPQKCSGLPVKRYSQESMIALLAPFFNKIKCFEEKHSTPFNTIQSFTYCGFSKTTNKYK